MRPQINEFVANLTRTQVTTQQLFNKEGKDVDLNDLKILKDHLSTYYY